VQNTQKGDVLTVICSDGIEYDLPPVAKGAYAIAPNEKFLVYCTNYGYVYAVRAGSSTFTSVMNIKNKMGVFRMGETPSLSVSILAGDNQYWARIYDRITGQSYSVKIPAKISY